MIRIEKTTRKKKLPEDFSFLTVGKPGRPKSGREQITLMLSPRSVAIIRGLKQVGPGWQEKIDAALLVLEVP